jgi:hypothetical protein
MITLGEDALTKVKAGLTTAEELLRVITEVKEMRTLCPSCAGTIALDFTACPHCGKHLKGACPSCHRALQPGWQFCPYCAKGTERASDRPSGRRIKAAKPTRELPASNVAAFKKGSPG